MAERAVITGIGPVTPCGIGKEALWAELLVERSPISRITRFKVPPLKAGCAAEINGFDAAAWFSPHEIKRWDRCTQFAMVAAKLAIGDAGLAPPDDPLRFAVSFGSALGGIADAEEQHTRFLADGAKAVSRSLALQIYGGATHSNISIQDARLDREDIGYINAHASGTPQNDVNEAAQIAAVFGPRLPPVSGTKPFTGHALGAAGAKECAVSLLAMEHGWIPPTLHLEKTGCAPSISCRVMVVRESSGPS